MPDERVVSVPFRSGSMGWLRCDCRARRCVAQRRQQKHGM